MLLDYGNQNLLSHKVNYNRLLYSMPIYLYNTFIYTFLCVKQFLMNGCLFYFFHFKDIGLKFDAVHFIVIHNTYKRTTSLFLSIRSWFKL